MTDDDEPTRESIRLLARRTPAATGWAAADVVRRTSAIRRRRRLVGGIGAVVVAAAGLTLATRDTARHPIAQVGRVNPRVHVGARIGSATQLVANVAPLATADPSKISAVAAAEQRLSIRLLQTVDQPGNVSVSPASLYLALGMLQNGARGQTATEISDALQAAGLSTADQNAGLAGLTDELAAAAKHAGIVLESANSLWAQRGLPVEHRFLADLATYYRAGVWQADFAGHNADALAAIDKWTAEHTHGKIAKLFDRLDSKTVLVLANAIYFHAAWATPFEGNLTDDGRFVTGNGAAVDAQFMAGRDGLLSGAGSGYEAAQLPYRGGRFAALAIKPTSGTLADFDDDLTPAMIDSIASSLHPGSFVYLPKFTTSSSTNLVPVLDTLGMHDAFGPACDLSGFFHAGGIQVDQVLQRAFLQVGENGTTAAAVTGISGELQSLHIAPPGVRFDHPFLFLIRDTKTGAILFASKIDDPTAS